MVQQGRVAAAALSAQPNLDPASAAGLVQRLGGRSEARIRVLDTNAKVIADSAMGSKAPIAIEKSYPAVGSASRKRLLYRVGARGWRAFTAVRAFFEGPPSAMTSSSNSDVTPRDVVRKALAGSYGATLRESEGQRSLTLYSALPIRAGGNGSVVGAVMVSQSTSRILRSLWHVRLDLVEVFALSVLMATVLSLVMAATIARPLIRLRDEADELLDHRGRLRRTFGGSRRRDEIGDLTRALERLTGRLERHLAFVEGFSADVSHEFKNPLASIRSAAELLTLTDQPAQREQLAITIDKEVARLGRLLNGVREISRVDAAPELEIATAVDVRALLSELASTHDVVDISLPAQPVLVTASEDRLVQALRNIIDNAISFSPPDGRVRASLAESNGRALVSVDDSGPGIPPEHLERIFDRFFSFRPQNGGDRGNHDGLGLAIARAIVEGYGGSIRASNLDPHGARIEVSLPVART